ncbi:phenylacetate-CoA oxygenase subunit PaaJ [Trinickia sp. LjRoot230]|uniref:1,2-phenylacetyl-CoA epoxidase subunit PaaD n=1 Tax=Trinickia sp. LjRoot230 TaxID=3342288 RepID=UPI003ECEA0B3
MFRTPNHLSAPVSTRADSIDDDIIQHAWSVLEAVPDPEIPVVSIRELGILRNVTRAADGTIEVVITPTYSGCPAMAQIAEDIGRALDAAKLGPYRIETTLAPAWTTEWITDAARAKLHAYGIAPPVGDGASASATAERVIRFMPSASALPTCPRCNSAHTERLAQFGSTACKALYRCLDCREPFDYFKPY